LKKTCRFWYLQVFSF